MIAPSPVLRRGRRICVLIAAVSLLSACAEAPTTLTVWSNVAETAYLVERYNAVHERDVTFRYVENLTSALTQRHNDADVVVGRWINTPPLFELFSPRATYSEAVPAEPSQEAKDAPLLQLSFNTPTLLMTPETAMSLPPITVSMDELATLYQEDEQEIHFAPGLDAETLYTLYRARGFVPTVNERGNPIWDEARFTAADEAIHRWRTDYNGGGERERTYIERYLYEPPLRLIDKGRLSVILQRSDQAFSWRFFSQRHYDFRWLSSPGDRITANDNVVYAGVVASTRAFSHATDFLSWLIAPQTQIEVLHRKLEDRLDSFGFLEGFSTIDRVNEVLANEIYPELAGTIPIMANVIFPPTLPRYWDEARHEVVFPTLQREEHEMRGPLERWYRQRGD